MKNKDTKQNKNGFTLVEMLVSIAVFMSVMTVAVSSLISIINVNRKTQEIKSVVDNVTFAIDSISRNARIGTNYSCVPKGQSVFVGDCLGGGNVFEYMKTNGRYTQYKWVDSATIGSSGMGNIQRVDGCDATGNNCSVNSLPTTWQSMTAPTNVVNITNMTFYVIGSGTEGLSPALRKQPRVIITVEGTITESNGTKTIFTVQTTSSQRTRQSNG